MDGFSIAMAGLALCALLCGCGSALGLCFTGQAASGVLAEDNKKYGKVLIMVVLPATQGIYGFVLAIIGQGYLTSGMSVAQGWAVLFAVLPLAITGLITAIFQSKTAVSGIYAIAKDQTLSGKLILFPAMIEFYAILGFIISILLLGAL